jgi:hypothetical protein
VKVPYIADLKSDVKPPDSWLIPESGSKNRQLQTRSVPDELKQKTNDAGSASDNADHHSENPEQITHSTPLLQLC